MPRKKSKEKLYIRKRVEKKVANIEHKSQFTAAVKRECFDRWHAKNVGEKQKSIKIKL